MSGPTFIPTARVADMLTLSEAGFLRQRQRLEDDFGFPQPMPHCRRPLLWRADQVSDWIEGQGLPRDIEARIDPALIRSGAVVLLAEARRP